MDRNPRQQTSTSVAAVFNVSYPEINVVQQATDLRFRVPPTAFGPRVQQRNRSNKVSLQLQLHSFEESNTHKQKRSSPKNTTIGMALLESHTPMSEAALKLHQYRQGQDEMKRRQAGKCARFEDQRPKVEDFRSSLPLQYFIKLGDILYPFAFGETIDNVIMAFVCVSAVNAGFKT